MDDKDKQIADLLERVKKLESDKIQPVPTYIPYYPPPCPNQPYPQPPITYYPPWNPYSPTTWC